jgi:AcrR family transcriptional regulator
VSNRKQEILHTAIEIVADEGYAGLSMRALARASGMKLGALQYHFRTAEAMLRELVAYIAAEYEKAFEALRVDGESLTVRDIAIFVLDDSAGEPLMGDRLWPQLWAMQQVEPLVADLVDDVYAGYLSVMQQALKDAGSDASIAEALCLMSLLEGETLFTGRGRRWASERQAVRASVLAFIDARYPSQ